MKIEMKKFFLFLMFAFLSVPYVKAQGTPPPPPGCECCAGLEPTAYNTCISNCQENGNGDYCGEGFPINSNILFLFGAAISLGSYFFYKNHKKRPLKN